ncbi:MAG: DUF296 domain-containing protein [Candidatus Diapherotrites archaeon]
MMGEQLQSQFFREKSSIQHLTIVLSEGEDILSSLKQALLENKIHQCKVIECNGIIKEGFMNCFWKNSYKAKNLKGIPVSKASGKFSLGPEVCIGDLHVSVLIGNQLWQGTLVEGTAKENFSLKVEFIKFE